SVKGRTSDRVKAKTPTGTPSRNIGTPSTVRNPPSFWASGQVYSGSAVTSVTCTTCPSSKARPMIVPRFRHHRESTNIFEEFRREAIRLGGKEGSACLPGNGGFVSFAQPGG